MSSKNLISTPGRIKKDTTLNAEFWPKQAEAFTTTASELLYGGATRGGKSYFTRLALAIWCFTIPGLQCAIVRKFYEDVCQNHMEGPDGYRSMLHGFSQRGLCSLTKEEVRFSNGSLISLQHCSTEEAMQKAQGIPRHVLVFEEATQIPERRIRFMRVWCTMPEEMKDKLPEQLVGLYPHLTRAERREFFPRIIYTANAIGESMGFFRREFVKSHEKGSIWAEGAFRRQYIEALVEHNPSENAKAVRGRVESLGDAAMADALLNANWDAPVGDFFPQYSDEAHTCKNFTPPDHFFKFRTFDWGSSEPFCVQWWAVSDGEPFREGTETHWFPRGALILYREWYGCAEINPSKGLQLRNEEVAQGIVARTVEKTSELTLTDSLPFQDRGMTKHGKKYLIADVFREHGVPLTLANTARVYGWKQVKDRLIGKEGLPLIYFQESCVYTREYLPALPRHPRKEEDAAEDGEATHSSDGVRYACATKPIVEDAPKTAESVDFRSLNERRNVGDIVKSLNRPGRRNLVKRR